jgi:hypothetical protein
LLGGVCNTAPLAARVGAVPRRAGEGLGQAVDRIIGVAYGPVLGCVSEPVADPVEGVAVAGDDRAVAGFVDKRRKPARVIVAVIGGCAVGVEELLSSA